MAIAGAVGNDVINAAAAMTATLTKVLKKINQTRRQCTHTKKKTVAAIANAQTHTHKKSEETCVYTPKNHPCQTLIVWGKKCKGMCTHQKKENSSSDIKRTNAQKNSNNNNNNEGEE